MFNANMNQIKDDSQADINCQQQPTDSISGIAWMPNPQSNVFAVSCWDGKVKVYLLNPQSGLQQQFETNINEPCTDLCWNNDGSMIFVAAGSSIKAIQCQSQQVNEIGKLQSGISNIFWSQQMNCVITTSFDGNISFWQLTNPGNPIKQVKVNKKIYCSAVKDDFIILGLQEEHILIESLSFIAQNGSVRSNSMFQSSNLGTKSQINAIQIGNKQGKYLYAVASIDGRANLSFFQLNNNGNNSNSLWNCESIMTFKCHKEDKNNQQLMYAVNGIGFNPRNDSFVYTAGSDGKIYFWDIQHKNKIKTFNYNAQPVTCASMSPNGQFLAYGIGYDWFAGYEKFKDYKNYKICVHMIPDNETKYTR